MDLKAWAILFVCGVALSAGAVVVASYNSAISKSARADTVVAVAHGETNQARGQAQLNGAALLGGDAQHAQETHAAAVVAHVREAVAAIPQEAPDALDRVFAAYDAGARRLRLDAGAYHARAMAAYCAGYGVRGGGQAAAVDAPAACNPNPERTH